MNYYKIAITGQKLDLLTYKSEREIEILTVVDILLSNKQKEGFVIEKCEKPTFECIEIISITDKFLPKEYLKTINFISGYYFCTISEALSLFVPFEKEHKNPKIELKTDINLSNIQQKALDFCLNEKISLLFGDTGSGKTEIYMKLFERLINNNKTAIFLMPEISLTPQIEKRLKEHFGELVAIWHSKITKTTKEKIILQIKEGKIKIVAGARSALFLPLENLGVIVVDEEHDDSYKSSSRPRYNARDMAIVIGEAKKIPVILGSATPSATSYKRFPFFRLKGQYFDAKKRYITIHSCEETPQDLALNELKKNFQNQKQAIVFSPTRANFKYLICKECAKSVECPFCSVGMSLHNDKNLIKCHYCNYTESIPKSCPSCKKDALMTQRIGTEEVVGWIKNQMPVARVQKFDRDSVNTNKKLKTILDDFNKQKIDILVGTQMLSKGHNYHEVNLALILGIDYVLNTADFRAPERTISLILQIAGRAGRKEDAIVIIQTINDEYIKKYLDDYEFFLKDELENRRELYPPFKKLARVLFAHTKDEKAKNAMQEMVYNLKNFKDIEIVGSGKCAIEKIANKFRYHILLRGDSSKSLLNALRATKNELAEIDIDPVQFG